MLARKLGRLEASMEMDMDSGGLAVRTDLDDDKYVGERIC